MASLAPANNPPNVPDPFAPLQQLILRIDSESCAKEVIDKARDLNTEEQQLLVDVISMTLNKSKILFQWHAHAWTALIKIASSAHVFARNRTIISKNITTGSDASVCIKVIKQIWDDTSVLCPKETVLVSVEGRALITDLNVTYKKEDSNTLSIRYFTPELSLEGSQPTKATDIWALGCLGHKVLSGEVPFCQCSSNWNANSAIAQGDKPAQPGQDGRDGGAISDMMWDLLMLCWEYVATDRPTSLKVQEMLSHMHIGDGHLEPSSESTIEPEATKSSIINVKLAKTILSQILGSHQVASLQVPKHLRDTLSWLIRDSKALHAAQVAAKKLNCDDTQTLVDLIELVVKDLPYLPKSNFTGKLLQYIMESTHIFPQYYRASSAQYDLNRLVSETCEAKLYEGRVLKICIYIANPGLTRAIVSNLALWANTLYPNILPFHGVFHENLTESPQFCVVLPHLKNGMLEDYAPTLPQKSRLLLISDVVSSLAYLQNVMGWVLPDILTTDVYTDHFYKSSPKIHFYSFGCLSYQVLSRKLPYYQVPNEQVYKKVCHGSEPLIWPDHADAEMDEIDDKAWKLIMKCCAHNHGYRPDWSQIQEMLANVEIEEDHCPPTTPLPIPKVQALRSHPEIDLDRAEIALNQAEVLYDLLSELMKNPTKDVAGAVVEFEHDEIQTTVDFLDQALKERLTITEERNHVLAILSRISSSTLIFPQCYELRGVKYDPRKHLAEGGCGIAWVKEVILWAHSSHPNVLPFLGVFLDIQSNPPQICLVSPFMKNGNLRDCTARLPQKSWLPLLLSQTILLQENVLISDEGCGLITDFGMSHVTMAMAATGSLSLTLLRFSMPETVFGKTPMKKFDIWSLGCLLYKEMPKRPGSTNDNDAEKDEYDLDDDIEEDYDAIDDHMWSLIDKCCASEPKARPDIASVQELIVNMKIYDDHLAVKDVPGTNILKSRVNPKIDLTRVEELFDQVKEKLAALPKNGSTDA
ncbi:hypothetical protein AN958_05346 [Leucoagaricus sp. SymC.cos]|nr:hypothetical protein AN958_05346 [Leucoagaricus sp. SymC.cos]